jgi:Ca2+-binding EF-hand superfamily protein
MNWRQFIAEHLPFDEVRGLKELFDAIDADDSGTISIEELREVGLSGRGARELPCPGVGWGGVG